jgi:hypothetical protein
MSISIAQLEDLLSRLTRLQERLQTVSSWSRDAPLAADDPLVRLAEDCDFLLPTPLNAATLAETVERKIGNVHVLLDRAHLNEGLPEDVEMAADNEDILVEQQYQPSEQRDSVYGLEIGRGSK